MLFGGKTSQDTNHAKGVAAEERAADYLKQQGYEIIHTRYKTKFGEVDIIARHEDVICFVEVKMRQSAEDALYAVTRRSRERIEKSALYFISEHSEMVDYAMRFDVITISKPFRIVHLDNAWEAGS